MVLITLTPLNERCTHAPLIAIIMYYVKAHIHTCYALTAQLKYMVVGDFERTEPPSNYMFIAVSATAMPLKVW